ncbi:Immunity protein 52 [Paraburkholderia lycopersici]|uniref:Immunity protein 52 n=2 Tax=Paraburkholderia lycopersici TaxID=416944 RepID=A0A1G7D648_9BURK|nr:Immunity protein 52 [Paraburkholderia lycopersici]
MNLFSQHRDRVDLPSADFSYHLNRLQQFFKVLVGKDRFLGEWYLTGENLNDALRFPVYGKDHHPLKTAIEELDKKCQGKNSDDNKIISLWNGAVDQKDGASLTISIDGGNILPRMIDFNVKESRKGYSRLGDYQSVAEVISKVADIYGSFYVSYGPRKYVSKKVFPDRLGVSWMLYLPRVLTTTQVPEARALIPVESMLDGRRLGTIIVSETEGAFDVSNPEHVDVANAIEIRLADQDLLPRFIDL